VVVGGGQLNRLGGVRGRPVLLLSYDDGYDPANATRNVIEMITSNRIFGFLGSIGTPTVSGAEPERTASALGSH